MTWKPMFGDRWTDVLALLTFGAIVAVAWLLAGAGFFSPHGHYPSANRLNQIGGFLGGTFAPIVLAWAARTFFLQRQQLIASMQAMAKQAELQVEANLHQASQLAALERHREEDRLQEDLRTAPRFSLRSIAIAVLVMESQGGPFKSSSDEFDMKLLLERLTSDAELEHYTKAAWIAVTGMPPERND